MRSLAINFVERLKTNILPQINCIKIDTLSEVAFFATENEVFAFSLKDKEIRNSIKVDGNGIISIEYVSDDECIMIATSNGDLCEWRLAEGSLECVGTMESGITCIQWSPDQEVFVLTTGDDKLVLMSRELDPFFETELNPQEFGEAELITVGWGKKETQFHGTEGKPTAADLKPKVADPILPWDDKKVRISWCEDGQYFAVSSVDPVSGSRKIRIRSRDGNLYSTNEVTSGLEYPIHWRPSGNLIASSQRKPNKHDVIFFEANGLRHGEFTLPFKPKEVKVVELIWNKSSDILLIWLEELQENENEMKAKRFSAIQLWTRNNYHWYLKQEYQFSSMGEHVNGIIWDSESSLKLHVICNGGVLYQIDLKWTVLQSKDSCVAVIDGSLLLLTPFPVAVVPPPMSLFKVKFESAINHVCFGSDPRHAVIALSDGSFNFLNLNANSAEAGIEKLQISRDDDMVQALCYSCVGFTNLTPWIGNSYLAVCKTKSNEDAICYITQKDEDSHNLIVKSIVSLEDKVIAIATNSDVVAIELHDGSVFTTEKENSSVLIKPWLTPSGSALRFPYPCQSMAVTKVNHEDIVIGMTDHYRLYINEKLIADNCTSFAIHDEHLVFTTHKHHLRCVQLSQLTKYIKADAKESLQNDIFSRNLERGSKIVSAVCKDTKVVLQMPRGNLETIHPRALVISYLKKLLNKCLYKEAILSMKRHRINLNLIHDHNPELFFANVPTFIKSVNSENDINLFLADLQEDDVTRTFYQSCYQEYSGRSATNGSKIDKICSSIRDAIYKNSSKSLFLCLLTSYAKQSKPDLETVLKLIKSLKERETEANVTHEKALKHILYLIDVNELYDVALGLYDFDIVLMIAEKSNKDPKEYLPFLNELKSYETNYCRFKIDSHLKRYKKALVHIYACGESRFEECLGFILSHELYKDALNQARNEADNFKKISIMYGSHLMKNKFYAEAAIIFSRVHCHEDAKEAFVKSHNWKLAIAEAIKLEYSKEELTIFANTLSENMKDLKRWKDVANILELYTEDHESAVSAYLNGNLWEEALRMIHGTKRLDLIETNFKPTLLESFFLHHENVSKSRENFTKYKERLAVVRAFKEKQSIEVSEGIRDDPENDLFSESSSVSGQSAISSSSRGSRSSGHSSKSRRKQQRKKYSLKEGSKFEDFALLEALAEIVNANDQIQDEIGCLLQMLVLFAYESEASLLQNDFGEILSLIKRNMNEIWSHNSVEAMTKHESGPQSTVNSIIGNMQIVKRIERESGLPEPTKPFLRENIQWRLANLI